MTMKIESQFQDMFDQAVQTFGETLKTGVKIQEEIGKWWSDALDQTGPVQQWQKRSQAMVSDAIPAAQKNAEEWLRMIEQNHKRSMELLKKAFETDPSMSGKNVQARTQELWGEALELVRDSAQSMAQTNMKMMELWSDVLRKNLNSEMSAAKAAANSAAKAAAAAPAKKAAKAATAAH